MSTTESLCKNDQVSERTHDHFIATLVSCHASCWFSRLSVLTHSLYSTSLLKKNERSSVNRLSDPCYMCYVTNFHVSALSWRLSIGVRGGSVSWTISLPCGFKLCGYQYISQTLTIFQIFSTDLWCVLILVTWVTEIELILEPWFN